VVLNKQDVLNWKNDSVTKAFFAQLAEDRDAIAASIIQGDCTGVTVDQTAQLLAREIGKTQTLQAILDFAVEDLLAVAFEEGDDE